jgi:hypothetical protein
VKVSLKTHGGWGAPIYRALPPKAVEVDELPKEEAGALLRLIDAAKRAPAPKEEPSHESVPKGMSYTITIEEDGEPVVLHQSENMSPAFEALLNWLNNYFGGHK